MREIVISKQPLRKDKDDSIRIKNENLSLDINVYTGKQGDYFISFCPSLNISGYGKTEIEAEDFIKVEMRTFCEDILSMNSKERVNFLSSLGFKQERFRTKNFSRSYVDENGRLQDFDQGTLQHKVLMTA